MSQYISRVDGKEVARRDWMFKLVGNESFNVGKANAACVIKIEPFGGFSYQYSLEVNVARDCILNLQA